MVADVFHLYFFPSVLSLSIGCFRLNLLISFFGCLYFFETRISFNEMRYSQRNLVLAFGSFSLLMLLIYWILGEMLFKENVRNTVPVSSRKKMTDIHNFTLLEDGLWQSFKRHYLISSVISQRNNNQSTLTGVACASEVYLTTCGNPGMAALILMSLDHISVCLEIGGMPTVFWRNCYTVCPSNASINAWELYFEPVNPNIEKQLDKVYCLGSYTTPEIAYQSRFNRRNNTKDTKSKGLLPLSFHRRDIEGFDGIITRNVRLFANSLINRYIRVLPKIEMVVNDFFSKHMDKYNLLAVHIRGTDHGDETMDGKLPSLITWIKNAKYQLDSLPSPKRIFVASDNIESINKFVAEFGDKVKVQVLSSTFPFYIAQLSLLFFSFPLSSHYPPIILVLPRNYPILLSPFHIPQTNLLHFQFLSVSLLTVDLTSHLLSLFFFPYFSSHLPFSFITVKMSIE